MTKAAIQGDYSDLKFIKSRKVAVISIEIPIEAAPAFVAAFGTPNPATTIPVAIARLQSQPEAPQAEKPKRSWNDMPRSQQAALKCADPDFQQFLSAEYRRGVGDAVQAASIVRQVCDVKSRADLDHSEASAHAWDRMYSNYQMWKAGAAA